MHVKTTIGYTFARMPTTTMKHTLDGAANTEKADVPRTDEEAEEPQPSHVVRWECKLFGNIL